MPYFLSFRNSTSNDTPTTAYLQQATETKILWQYWLNIKRNQSKKQSPQTAEKYSMQF